MAGYYVDEIPYEIDDGLDLHQTVAQIRQSNYHKEEVAKLRAPTPGKFLSGEGDDRDAAALMEDYNAMSFPRRVGEAYVGAGEAAAQLITVIPGLVAGGAGGLSALAQGEDLDTAQEAAQHAAGAFTYEPRSTGGKLASHGLGKVWEAAKHTVGMAGGYAPGSQQAMGIDFTQPLDQPKDPSVYGFSEEGRAASEFGFEAIATAGPAARGIPAVRAAREAKVQARKAQELLDEMDRFEAEQTAKQRQFQEQATQPEFDGFSELTKEAEPRTPYNLPESLKRQLEAELNPPVEQRMVGQGELFGEKPMGVVERPVREPSTPLEYTPVEGRTTPQGHSQGMTQTNPGAQALAQGMDATRPGATQPLTMPGLDYPGTLNPTVPGKPHLRGPVAEQSMPAGKPNIRMKQHAEDMARRVDPPAKGTERTNAGWSEKLWKAQLTAKPNPFHHFLDIIEKYSQVPYYRELAKKLREFTDLLPKVEIVADEIITLATRNPRTTAAYEPKGHRIMLSEKALGHEGLFLHEALHAATYHALERGAGVRFKTGTYAKGTGTKANQRMYDLYNSFRSQWLDRGLNPEDLYGIRDVHEFIAEGFTNPDFQAILARTKLPRHLQGNKIRTLWDKFIQTVSKLLGFEGKDNFLSETIKAGAELMAESGEARAMRRGGPDQPGALGVEWSDFKQQLKDRNINIPDKVAKQIWKEASKKPPKPLAHPNEPALKAVEEIQREYADQRSLREIAPEVKNLTEDSRGTQFGLNTVGKILSGRFIAKGNALLSWVSSQTHWIKQEATLKANSVLHGKSKKNPDPGTYNYRWKSLGRRARIAVNEVGQALNNAQAWLGKEGIQAKAKELLGRELTANELQSYLDRVEWNKKVLKDLNAVFLAEGKQPIAELPHYWSPAVFNGPFKIRFMKNGETVLMDSSYLRPNIKKLQKQFPEYKIEEIPEFVKDGQLDWTQFDVLLRQLNKEMADPAAKAIREALRRQGISARGLKRKGVKGAAGTEGGIKGVRKYEEVSERYIRQAYDFIANRKLDEIHKQVNEMPEANHVPHTKAWSLEAIDVARGRGNQTLEGLSNMLSGGVSALSLWKLPHRFTRDLLKASNKVKIAMLLGFGNVVFLGAQVLQAPTFMPAKITSMAVKSGMGPGRIMRAIGNALANYSKWDRSVDAQKLAEVGAFDATFKYDWSSYAGDANPHFRQTLTDHLSGLSTMMWVESHIVRRPAAHMFLEMLREMGYDKVAKDKMEIYKVAREMTDHYMVSMRFHEKPHAFSRSGLIGQALSPLMSFPTTWLGMLREYTKQAASGMMKGHPAEALPLAVYLSMSMLTTGLLGQFGVQEADAFISWVNEQYGYNIPTVTELILKKTKSKSVRYGALSAALPGDIQVGPTFAAPTITGTFAPGLQQIGDVANLAGVIGRSTGLMGEANRPSSTEWREAFKGVTPRSIWGALEKHYTQEGHPYQERSGKAGPYVRDEQDWIARYLSTYTTKEREAKATFYEAERQSKVPTGRYAKRYVDAFMTGEDQKHMQALWQELFKAHPDVTGDEISRAIMAEIENRITPSNLKAMGKMKSPQQQRLLMLYIQMGGFRGQ